MRFLTANYLYPLHTDPLKEGVLQISDKGQVVSIFEETDKLITKESYQPFKNYNKNVFAK